MRVRKKYRSKELGAESRPERAYHGKRGQVKSFFSSKSSLGIREAYKLIPEQFKKIVKGWNPMETTCSG
jgi:hypothetical protein